MNRVDLRRIPLKPKPAAGTPKIAHLITFGAFLAVFALVWLRVWLAPSLFGDHRWPEGFFLLLACSTLLVAMTRQLPGQNVLLAAIIVAVMGAGIGTVGALTSVPFGPFVYTENIGEQLFNGLPWVAPLIWIIMIFTSRGVARLTLRPWRKTRLYGIWVIGLTSVLVMVLDFGLEPFASRVKRYWLWNPTKLGIAWYGAPWVNFLGWGMAVALILAFTTPALINKKPVKQPPDYHPLIIWGLLNLLFATGVFALGMWPASVVILAGSALVSVFAIRGARW